MHGGGLVVLGTPQRSLGYREGSSLPIKLEPFDAVDGPIVIVNIVGSDGPKLEADLEDGSQLPNFNGVEVVLGAEGRHIVQENAVLDLSGTDLLPVAVHVKVPLRPRLVQFLLLDLELSRGDQLETLPKDGHHGLEGFDSVLGDGKVFGLPPSPDC